MVGDPPNVVLGSKLGLGFSNFLMYNGPLVLVIMPLATVVMYWRLKKDIHSTVKLDLEKMKSESQIIDQVALMKARCDVLKCVWGLCGVGWMTLSDNSAPFPACTPPRPPPPLPTSPRPPIPPYTYHLRSSSSSRACSLDSFSPPCTATNQRGTACTSRSFCCCLSCFCSVCGVCVRRLFAWLDRPFYSLTAHSCARTHITPIPVLKSRYAWCVPRAHAAPDPPSPRIR